MNECFHKLNVCSKPLLWGSFSQISPWEHNLLNDPRLHVDPTMTTSCSLDYETTMMGWECHPLYLTENGKSRVKMLNFHSESFMLVLQATVEASLTSFNPSRWITWKCFITLSHHFVLHSLQFIIRIYSTKHLIILHH